MYLLERYKPEKGKPVSDVEKLHVPERPASYFSRLILLIASGAYLVLSAILIWHRCKHGHAPPNFPSSFPVAPGPLAKPAMVFSSPEPTADVKHCCDWGHPPANLEGVVFIAYPISTGKIKTAHPVYSFNADAKCHCKYEHASSNSQDSPVAALVSNARVKTTSSIPSSNDNLRHDCQQEHLSCSPRGVCPCAALGLITDSKTMASVPGFNANSRHCYKHEHISPSFQGVRPIAAYSPTARVKTTSPSEGHVIGVDKVD